MRLPLRATVRPWVRLASIAAVALLVTEVALPSDQQSRSSMSPRPGPEALRRRFQSALDGFHAAGQFPGATLGVVLSDGTSFGLATGFSDRAARIPMTPSDRMLMGSVGKTFVAAVALQLVQEKRLALTDRIERWFAGAEWFPKLPNGRDITVRMLMNHTSGLARYALDDRFTAELTRQPDKTWRPEELLAYVLGTAAYFPESRAAIALQVNTSVTGTTAKPLVSFLADLAQIAALHRPD